MEKNDKNSTEYIPLSSRKEEFKKRNKSKNNKRRRIICTILLVALLIFFYGIGAWGYQLIKTAENTMSQTYNSAKIKKSRNASEILKKEKPFSVLLLGTDTGDLGRTFKGRTDTMMVITVNPKTEVVSLTSIPRDTAVHIPGSDNEFDKINSAYTYGGVPLAIKTVQQTLKIPIDFYILINMGGLTKIVDDLGGVTVTPPLSFHYENVTVTKGQKITLNGKEALSYSRMRDDDPQGDYGRQKRQKQIITAIIKKAMSVSSLSKYDKTLNAIQHNMETDLSYDDMMLIETYYKKAGKNIKSYVLKGQSEMLDGLSYQVAPASEKKKVSDEIRHQLGLKNSTYNFKKNSPFVSSNENEEYSSQSTGNNNYNDYENNNYGTNTSNQDQQTSDNTVTNDTTTNTQSQTNNGQLTSGNYNYQNQTNTNY